MNRIKKCFDAMKASNRCGLIAYVTCGDPDVETTVKIVLELEKAGADAVELGIPFSDPIADGPVIQEASHRALKNGTTIDDVFQIARQIRSRSDIPLIAFSYLNPVLHFGVDRFAEEARDVGIDAVLLTDLPPEAAKDVRGCFRDRKMGMIFLLAPTSTAERIQLVDKISDGFVYYVSTTGVTGARADLDPTLIERLTQIRAGLSKPLAVGFGISRREHHQQLAGYCDAVVVGSAIVRAVAKGNREGAPSRAGAVVREILGT